ncbi:hypothetical protein ACTHQ6_15415 [Arthrobacter sp. SAFR-179]|uniref:hypothetical protein n=1 Tax=Arthrobacter sp. SAFR-179 TaxID=3387279 RepID=UPI003F7C1CAF
MLAWMAAVSRSNMRPDWSKTLSPVVLAALAATTITVTASSGAAVAGLPSTSSQGGQLTAAVAVSDAADDMSFSIKIENVGDAAVNNVRMSVRAPEGVVADLVPALIETLAPGASKLIELTPQGSPSRRPASLEIAAVGTTNGVDTSAVVAVSLVDTAPVVAVTVTGNTILSDTSPADLLVVAENKGDAVAKVTLRAFAGQNSVRLAQQDGDIAKAATGTTLTMSILANSSSSALLRVEAKPPLRRGSASAVITAEVESGSEHYEVVNTTLLTTSLAADALPAVLGVSSALFIPGFLGVWSFLYVWIRDRRRVGVPAPDALEQIWKNKWLLIAAAGFSLVIAVVVGWLGIAYLFDTYSIGEILKVSIGTAVLGLLAGWLTVQSHRRKVQLINVDAAPLDVVRASAKADASTQRKIYQGTDGRKGLFVHNDRDEVIVAPQIAMTNMGEVSKLIDGGGSALPIALNKIEATSGEDLLWFPTDEGFVATPGPLPGAKWTGQKLALLRYENPPE